MTKGSALGYTVLFALFAFIPPFATLFIQGTYDRSWPLYCCTLPFGIVAFIFLIVFLVKYTKEQGELEAAMQMQRQAQAIAAQTPPPPPPKMSRGSRRLFVPPPIEERR